MRPDEIPKADISARYYAKNADILTLEYESVTFEEVHSDLIPYLAGLRRNALDVGAGSGRDAAWLWNRGWNVTAAEPSTELLHQAKSLHSDSGVRWIHDKLPVLSAVTSLAVSFDLIMLSAVWMHIEPKDESASILTLTKLMAKSGLLSLSIKKGDADTSRGFFDVDIDALVSQFEESGLVLIRQSSDPPLAGVEWKKLIFRKAGAPV